METALASFRFIHYASALFLCGNSFFISAIARGNLQPKLSDTLRWALIAASLLLALSWASWLCILTGNMGDGWSDVFSADALQTVLAGTTFGQVWLWRLPLVLICVALAFMRRGVWLLTIGSSAALMSLAAIGHPIMREGTVGYFLIANNAAHLTAAAIWLGGLWALILCLRYFSDPVQKAGAGDALRRYSFIGHFAVATVLATGFCNTALILQRFPSDYSSPYQTALALKTTAVFSMVGLAVFNRYYLVPNLKNEHFNALGMLVWATAAEIILGISAIALVSYFGQWDPR